MCSKLPSSLKTLIACCAAFDIGLLISEVLFTFPNPIFAGVIAIFPSTGVIYCDISAGSGRTPRAAFKL
jgi:uncharacterized membrane protein YgaE (UPF0421/DUF939 family)